VTKTVVHVFCTSYLLPLSDAHTSALMAFFQLVLIWPDVIKSF